MKKFSLFFQPMRAPESVATVVTCDSVFYKVNMDFENIQSKMMSLNSLYAQ